MVTYRAHVEYDGTRYNGFQIQADKPTIQGELERSLAQVTQQSVRVTGAGRTDSGVHAHGQVISFKAAWSHAVSELQRAMNATLPDDIAVRDVAVAPEGFHARFSASSREYVYRILNSAQRSPLRERYAWRVETPLAMERMAEASGLLVGRHDLAAFGQPPVGTNTTRNVLRAVWASAADVLADLPEAEAQPMLAFRIEANAFLRGMVRRIVGTLLQVGQQHLSVAEWQDILLSRDISRAAAPAPAQGLCLWRVRYEHGGAPEE